MTNIIIGDIAEGQKWYGQVELMKQQLVANHRSNNAFMSTWKQLSTDVKVFINMVAGKPRAFIYAEGRLKAWGLNAFGELGFALLGDFNTPTTVSFPKAHQILKISSGPYCTAILCEDTSLYVFGRNNYGQLGLGDNDDRPTPTLLGTGFIDVAMSSHLLVVASNGDLYSCGANYYGELGLGDLFNRNTLTLVGTGYSKVAANLTHSLAIADNGDLYAFGRNNALGNLNPQNGSILGTGDLLDRDVPTLVGFDFAKISAGNTHSLAITTNGDLYSTGSNVLGTLGLGDTDGRLVFTLVGGPYTDISAGRESSLAIYADYYAMAWGINVQGRLGLGDPDIVPYATVPTIVGERCIKCALNPFGLHGLLLTDTGEVYASGWNLHGELGLGLPMGFPPAYPDIPVVQVNEFTLVGAGYKYVSCGGLFDAPYYASSFAVKGQLSVAP